LFILDPIQIDKNKNDYFSNNCVQFMMESLIDLNDQLDGKLNILYGNTIIILDKLIKELKIDSIFVNMDYSPFSIKRDNNIKKICEINKIDLFQYHDLLLTDIETNLKENDSPYLVFSIFHNISKNKKVREINIEKLNHKKFRKIGKLNNNNFKSITRNKLKDFYEFNKDIHVNGGREKGLRILKTITTQKDYNNKRNLVSYESTNLSAYIKFGCLSIREIYYSFVKKLGNKNDLIKQLYWRDFYYFILFYNPETLTKKVGLKKYIIKWSHNNKKFIKWCNGETGFPIVDASMRHLNKCGYMPNRSRLIVANFLVKLLRIDWTWGEKYFAQNLVDYSVSNNLGNWQWVASIGTDYQNRIYNPVSQSKKADPDCIYIKKWIPELSNINNKDIHEWNTKYINYESIYINPLINYIEEYRKSKDFFKN
jgi:deoxyribodipyrimidine photo-lyase